ncbi:MAG: hypothetical protein A2475_02600 [Ignavibacteria bacterium RIFOXYC2_FULL_35_21]|nr:MAG: hypothetical protein A2220_00115 [Ignavibacteria bacterium RIFOXYA2_FULL_35_10]OGV19326.1 MAG: hypothetical protein A2475_02600 [Ignavibacteria bacterium RIFOXYC2_FULL_35_21]
MKRKFFIALFLMLCIFAINTKAENDTLMAKAVFKQVYSIMPLDYKINLPTKLEIIETDEINAYASSKTEKKGLFKVVITTAMLKDVIQSVPDRLAFIIGHELAHISLGHLNNYNPKNTDFLQIQYTRQQEIDADTTGLQYTLAAGYSYDKAIGAIKHFLDKGLDYSSFEGLGIDHPSWKERLIYIDKFQSSLWKSMCAFDNGVFFLQAEQLTPAVYCFRSITKEFPNCYEAWANLGYAYLMQYCEAFEPEDLRKYDIGQIATMGGFFLRAESLESAVRGINEDLWWDAVGAFKEALRLKSNLALVKVNLGIAYLLGPNGKDVGKAEKYFSGAIEIADKDTTIDDLQKAYIYYNSGLSYLANNDTIICNEKFTHAVELEKRFFATANSGSKSSEIDSYILYNRAISLMKEKSIIKNIKSRDNFEKYLKSTPPGTIWWKLAYKYYSDLSENLSLSKFTESDFKSTIKIKLKPIISYNLNSEKIITLADPIDDVLSGLKEYDYTMIPVAARTNLKKIVLSDLHFDILASDKVIAIFVKEGNPNQLILQSVGLTSEISKINTGMTLSEFESLIGEEKDNYIFKQLFNSAINYRFYYNLGLCLRINKETKTIKEFVITKMYKF